MYELTMTHLLMWFGIVLVFGVAVIKIRREDKND